MRTLRIGVVVGIFVLVLLILPSVLGQEPVELANDKGVLSSYRWLAGKTGVGPYGMAVLFTPPSSNWQIQRVRVYGARYGDQTEKLEFAIDIWATNRSILYSKTFPYTLFDTIPQWVYINVTGPAVSANFYVIIYASSTPQRGIRIGCDTTAASKRSEIAVAKTGFLADWSEVGWTDLKKDQANWMIRVIGGVKAITSTASQSTASQLFLGSISMSTLQQIGGAAAAGGSGFMGWYLTTRKRRFASGYMTKIDSTYNDYLSNREECIKRLTQMKHEAIQLLNKGRVDAPHFTLIDNKLNEYLRQLGG
jgi:hypothetical protein